MASANRLDSALSVSNSRVTLSLATTPSHLGVTCPGETLRPTLRFSDQASHYDSVSLRLVAETRSTIMGKDRWQAGSAINTGLGGSAMGISGIPVTSTENVPFFDQPIPLVSTSDAAEAAQGPEKHSTTGGASSRAGAGRATPGPGELSFAPGSQAVFEFVLPTPPEGHVLPTVRPPPPDTLATVSVCWMIKFEGVRKGLLRRNDHLTLEFPVVFPTRTTAPKPTTSVTHPFKYEKGDNSQEGLSLKADLSVTPLTHRSPVRFHLVLTPSSPSAAHLLSPSSSASSPLSVTCSLSRQVRTTPILRPENGRTFEWAATRIAMGDVSEVRGQAWVYEGTIALPDHEATVETNGLAIKYFVNCHLHSNALAHAALHVSVPVFVPSTPHELGTLTNAAGQGHGEQLALQSEGGEGDLPAYSQ
ncbi:hypothetical protein JCM10212_004040 [Sporobolomyces blumeae]